MSSLSFDAPQMSISAPKTMEWHMILDNELDQLSHSEMGFIGSLGFVGLGAALGLMPQLVEVISKLNTKPVKSPNYPFQDIVPTITALDIGTIAAIAVSLTIAAICLGLSGLYHHRNKNLAKTIRGRGKHGLPPAAPALHAV
jgi:hypothetical protein